MKYLMISVMMLLSITVIAQTTNLPASLDKMYSSKFAASDPGCVVLIARKGEVIYRKAFGMANLELKTSMVPANIFRIASLTKQFTAVAILQLHEKGLLSIEDDIKKYIPDFPSTEKITIANLASHTSGIQNIYEAVVPTGLTQKSSTPAELVEIIKKFPSDFKPGTAYRYSNSGYMLLGYIIEKVSGKSYEQYISDNIFKPLKMDHAYYDDQSSVVPGRVGGYAISANNEFVNANFLDQSFPYAAGALMMSVDDMYKWNKGLYTYTIIKKETLEKAFTPFTLTDGHKSTSSFGWGIGSFMGSPSRQHGGGIEGFSTFAIYLPLEDVFAVAFSNLERADVTGPTLLAAAHAAGKLTTTSAVSEKVTNRYLGTYRFPDGHQVKVYKEKGALFMKDSNSKVPWQMHFTDERTFYCEEVFPNIHVFTSDSSGKIDGFVIQFAGGEVKVKRIE